MPSEIKPPALGGSEVMYTHCNRFDDDLEDGDGSGLQSFYWCPVEEEHCGYQGSLGQWDKCVGVPAGYLEPTPIKTVQGCDCLLPFEYQPPVLASQEGPKKFVYTTPTDITHGHHGVWCAVVGPCGHQSSDAMAHYGPGGYGWSHWDVLKEQPPARPLLTGAHVGRDQHVLPDEVPEVRTQHGCTCKLPWKYAPARTCGVSEDDEDACKSKGGYMMSGWCVICDDLEYTGCARADQDAPWCAVEGDCGVASTDVKALLDASEGGYGWTHWDNCIGQPAGFIPHFEKAERETTKGATLSQKHGVTVERVEMKHHHKEVVKEVIGRSTADLTPSESKKLAIKKAVAEAVHKKGAAAAGADAGVHGARGRGGEQKTDKEIKALAKQMRQSIKNLDTKIQKLDESPASALQSATSWTLLAALLAVLVGNIA